MKRQHLFLLGLVLALLLLVGACGGGDDNEAAGTTAAGTTGGAEPVSGTIAFTAWTGDEQKYFQAVIDAFEKDNPDAHVKYTRAATTSPTVLSTAVEGGNPPDMASIAQPGVVPTSRTSGALKPISSRRPRSPTNFGQSARRSGTVDGKLYGLVFKAANKSTIWYNVPAFEDAGVKPPTTWTNSSATRRRSRHRA